MFCKELKITYVIDWQMLWCVSRKEGGVFTCMQVKHKKDAQAVAQYFD